MDLYIGLSHRSTRLHFPFAVVVHAIMVQLEFFPLSEGKTCDLAYLSALTFVSFQEHEKVWWGLLGENYNRIAARGLGWLCPRSALQRLLRIRLRWQSGLRPVKDSEQPRNFQKERKTASIQVRRIFDTFFFKEQSVVFSSRIEGKFDEELSGENYNCIPAGSLGGLSPWSALQQLLRRRFWWWACALCHAVGK